MYCLCMTSCNRMPQSDKPAIPLAGSPLLTPIVSPSPAVLSCQSSISDCLVPPCTGRIMLSNMSSSPLACLIRSAGLEHAPGAKICSFPHVRECVRVSYLDLLPGRSIDRTSSSQSSKARTMSSITSIGHWPLSNSHPSYFGLITVVISCLQQRLFEDANPSSSMRR